ncbi:GPP34 family phosphoprotein [Pseudarthrobacter sp. NamB4]|uniref:GOLPH3/VPS74 family protein n=1 Tax=Pseudarthrobacter sp. NamB4 TaxID=2576837 RepID=UPI0010FD26A6|nr:GPP34 family phosphoprotein [Pseudarthrobacter sp. NamB4]TLM72269.1 GPP34 family phosphoprotein [Pseudarthrobacter sp. NamB4]
MNAELPKAEELNLPQAFLLLATNDSDGKPEIPVFALRTTLAGAILAELERIGAIELRGKHVRDTGTSPETDFQRELDLIRHKSRPHTPRRWVSMLEGRSEVQRVYESMASLGIVEQVGEKHLGLFRTMRYPEKDHVPEAALLQKLEAALTDTRIAPRVPESTDAGPGSPEEGAAATAKPAAKGPDARTLALIALLEAAGLLPKLFPTADRVWADELAKDYWPARAVEDELRMIRLAEEEKATL